MNSNPGKGHIFGRDIIYQELAPESLIIGEGQEVKELAVGLDDQILTVIGGVLTWALPVIPLTSTGENLGTGSRVLANVTAGHFQFRTLTAGTAIIFTENANDIVIEVDTGQLLTLTGSGVLGTPTDGDLTDPIRPGAEGPAVITWTSSTLVVDAIDDLNELMGLLLPQQPPRLDSVVISMSDGNNTRSGAQILLAIGVVNNTGDAPLASGSQIFRVGDAAASTLTSSQFGPGNSGTLTSLVNGSITGTLLFFTGDDSGTNGDLTIVSDIDFPISTPGFFEAITADITSTVVAGVNKFQLSHSDSGSSNETVFLYDDISIIPITSNLSVNEAPANPVHTFSSGIAHLSSGSNLTVEVNVNNLSSNAYLSTGVVQLSSTNNLGPLINIDPGTLGIPSILAVSESPKVISGAIFTVGTSTFSSGVIRTRGRNAEVDGPWLDDNEIINVFSGNPSGLVQELNVPVSVGVLPGGADSSAKRIELGTGDNPDASSASSLLISNWASTTTLPAHEAKVIGGVLKQDITNYASNFIPSGPNYSSHDATQYATFFFRRSAISQFNINVTGTYSGIWVTSSDINFGVAPNGWLDMFQLYAGAGIPGQNGSNGCANGVVATGGSGSFGCTFGPETSSNATNNIILVRFRLDTGEQITNLSFS